MRDPEEALLSLNCPPDPNESIPTGKAYPYVQITMKKHFFKNYIKIFFENLLHFEFCWSIDWRWRLKHSRDDDEDDDEDERRKIRRENDSKTDSKRFENCSKRFRKCTFSDGRVASNCFEILKLNMEFDTFTLHVSVQRGACNFDWFARHHWMSACAQCFWY